MSNTNSAARRKGVAKTDAHWSMLPSKDAALTLNAGGGSYPKTAGGLYDLDTLDEEFVRATGPSSSALFREMEPKMDNLRALNKKATFKQMIRAADADAAEHAARVRKVQELTDAQSGVSEEAPTWRERVERRKRWDVKSDALKKEAATIIRLMDTPIEGTQAEVAKERMARWQRALELYVHCPEEAGVDLLKLLEKLIEDCGEEEELSEALSLASAACTNLVDQSSLAVRDATDAMADAEDAYHIRLEAHTMLANRAAEKARTSNSNSASTAGQR